jgi:hypothetical protein
MKIITVKVKPNAPETKFISQGENEFTIAIAAPPEQNKANIELIKFLSRHFKAEIKILRGLKSKTKIVRLT